MKYLIWGYYGYGNLGDEVMLNIIVKNILEYDKSATIYVKCQDEPYIQNSKVIPFKIESAITKKNKLFKLFHFLFNYIIKTFILIYKIDVFILGGGTQFIDKGKHKVGMIPLIFFLQFAKLLNRKRFAIGIGVDYLYHPLDIFYFKIILQNLNKIYFREKYGYNFAKILLGEKAKNKIFFTSDIFYSEFLPEAKRLNLDRINIGIQLADYYFYFENSNTQRQKFINEISSFIEMLYIKFNARITFFIFQQKIGFRDDLITKEVINSISKEFHITTYFPEPTQKDIKTKFQDIDLVIAMHFHTLVIASIYGIPFIGINHERKFEEICSLFDMPIIDLDEVNSKTLIQLTEKLLKSGKRPVVTEEIIYRSKLNFEWLNEINK